MNIKKLFPILFFGITLGCDQNSHPNFEQLPKESDINFVLDLRTKADSPALSILNVVIEEPKFIIDKDSSGLELYEIMNLKIDSRDFIYFNQVGKQTINVFNNLGEFEYTIGREGRGPGEFRKINTFEFNKSKDTLYVQEDDEIEVFSFESNSFKYAYTIPMNVYRMNDICLLNNTLYYSGFSLKDLEAPKSSDQPYNIIELTSLPINQYDLKVEKSVNSFGPLYKSYSGWWLLDAQLSNLKLHCNSESNTIVGIQENFGYFYGFSIEGEMKWISKLDNFKYATLVEKNINTPNITYSARSGAQISNERETASKFVVFQIMNDADNPIEVIINTENGEIFGGRASKSLFSAKNINLIAEVYVDWESLEKNNIIRVYEN